MFWLTVRKHRTLYTGCAINRFRFNRVFLYFSGVWIAVSKVSDIVTVVVENIHPHIPADPCYQD
jgi:hypothetical protein